MSNGNDTLKRSSKQGSKTKKKVASASTMRQSGLTYLPSTVGSLEDWLTSLQEDSHANPIVSPAYSEELPTIETSGLRRSELYVRWDRDTSSWRTYPDLFSLAQDGKPMGEPYLGSLPKQGMCADGQLWELTMWEHPTDASGGGVLPCPTPVADDTGNRQKKYAQGGTPLSMASGNWPTPDATPRGRRQGANRGFGADLNDAVYTWPTPSTMDHIERQGMRPSWAATNRTTGYLSEAIVQQGEAWATPRVSGQEGYETRATRKGHDIAMSYLESQAEYITENWPTPRKVDWKGSGPTVIRKDGKSRMDKLVYLAEQSQHGPLAQVTQTHGSESSESDQTSPQPSPKRLNPSFVEWLMGLPIGWTDLRPMTE